MKALKQIPLIAFFLIIASMSVAQAQDSRIQLASLDHLAAKASQTVDVSIDERLMLLAAKVLDKDDDKDIKKLITGLKGIYVKSFEFETDGQYTNADLESVHTQLRGASWSRLVNVVSKKEGNLEVYLMLTGEVASGLAVLHSNPKHLTVVNIVGPVDLARLADLEGQLGIPELGIEAPKQPKTKNDER